MQGSTRSDAVVVPQTVHGQHNGRQVAFERGRFLGKGGFARCYELIDKTLNWRYAGKAMSKKYFTKKSDRDKVWQEVTIHSSLQHPNIVRLYSFFEDANNVYMLLEVCPYFTLNSHIVGRGPFGLSEPEARYFARQVVSGCQYLHGLKIIHRDLKPKNILIASVLKDNWQLKIGDFGLATKVEFDGQQFQTPCGTLDYMAPEVLLKIGHSYGVGVWAIGCILYALLVGKPPFETASPQQTDARIRANEYVIPPRIGQHARTLIAALLVLQPEHRPDVFTIDEYEFFGNGLPSTPHFSL